VNWTRILLPPVLACCTAAVGAGENLKLVGQARLQYLFWPIYESRLYSPDGSYHESTRPLRLEIEYLRDIEAVELVEQTRSEWQRLPRVPAARQLWLEELSGLLPDVRPGDVLAVELDHREQSLFFCNDQYLGRITDPAFGRNFLAIWLSPESSRPELRRSLIGGT